jgi:tRNA1Val (adenine37-N6)-methyltransferase
VTVEVTQDSLLGGRVRYAQPRLGFRSGIEPLLLAASIPVRPGERMLEGGAGAGATLLCVAARAGPVFGVGVERDGALAALAHRNALRNGFATLGFIAARVEALPVGGPFHHAFANPPYHPESGTVPASAARHRAKQGHVGLFADWAVALAAPLARGGTLTFIVTTAVLPACMAAFEQAECGSPALFPLWPRSGEPAKLVLLRGRKGGRQPCRVLPGLILHDRDGQFTPEAEAVLRHAGPLRL